jgi:hypothetical protein
LNVGDEWTKRQAGGLIWTPRVVEITDNMYIIQDFGTRDNGKTGFDVKTLNCMFAERKDVRRERAKGDDIWLGKIFDFPLYIGKTWSQTVKVPT